MHNSHYIGNISQLSSLHSKNVSSYCLFVHYKITLLTSKHYFGAHGPQFGANPLSFWCIINFLLFFFWLCSRCDVINCCSPFELEPDFCTPCTLAPMIQCAWQPHLFDHKHNKKRVLTQNILLCICKYVWVDGSITGSHTETSCLEIITSYYTTTWEISATWLAKSSGISA